MRHGIRSTARVAQTVVEGPPYGRGIPAEERRFGLCQQSDQALRDLKAGPAHASRADGVGEGTGKVVDPGVALAILWMPRVVYQTRKVRMSEPIALPRQRRTGDM